MMKKLSVAAFVLFTCASSAFAGDVKIPIIPCSSEGQVYDKDTGKALSHKQSILAGCESYPKGCGQVISANDASFSTSNANELQLMTENMSENCDGSLAGLFVKFKSREFAADMLKKMRDGEIQAIRFDETAGQDIGALDERILYLNGSDVVFEVKKPVPSLYERAKTEFQRLSR